MQQRLQIMSHWYCPFNALLSPNTGKLRYNKIQYKPILIYTKYPLQYSNLVTANTDI